MDIRAKIFFEEKIASLEKEIKLDLDSYYDKKTQNDKAQSLVDKSQGILDVIKSYLGHLDEGDDVLENLKIVKENSKIISDNKLSLISLETEIVTNVRYVNRLKEELPDL